MNLIDKFIQLPKISLKQLEEKARVSMNGKNANVFVKDKRVLFQPQDINIRSALYCRFKNHKEKCQCQYHRMKRAYELSLSKSKKKIQSLPFQLIKKTNNQDNIERQERQSHKIGQRINTSLYDEIDENVNSAKQRKHTDNALGNIKASEKQTVNIYNKYQINSGRIQTRNQIFINIINQRFKNSKYKNKYLKTMIKFMKIKSNTNQHYIENSRSYIENKLIIVLNHFKMDQLLKRTEFSPNQIQMIAKYMNCQYEKVLTILEDIETVIKDMEQYIASLQKKKKEDAQILKAKQQQIQDRQLNNFSSSNSVLKELQTNINFNDLTNSQNNVQNLSKTTSKIEDEGYKQMLERMTIRATQNQWHRIETGIRKQSKRQNASRQKQNSFIREEESLANKNQNKKDKQSQQCSENSNSNEFQKLRNTRSSQYSQNPIRSSRANNLDIITENQLKNNVFKKIRKVKKKINIVNQFKELEISSKYSSIAYQQFCSKKNFQILICQIERLDKNDEQRAQIFFNTLNVGDYLDEIEKIERLVNNFRPLMSQNCKHHFLKYIIMIRDKRMIEKLEKELDLMLEKIKQNDQRHFGEQIYQESKNKFKSEHKLPQICDNLITSYKPENNLNKISKIIYYEAVEDIQNRIKSQKQQQTAKHLEQIEFKSFAQNPIKPELTSVILHKENKQANNLEHTNTILKNLKYEKKVLKYMKTNHQRAFQFLAQEFKNLSSSLHERISL